MNFLRWLISGVVGLLIGAALIGTILLMTIIGPFLALIGGGVITAILVVIGFKEFLDDAAAERRRRQR